MTPDDAVARRCERRVLRLFHALDRFDYPALLAEFIASGVWHRGGAVLVGHAAILAAMQARPATLRVRHIVTNFLMHEDRDPGSPVATFCMTAYRHETAAEGPVVPVVAGPIGIYDGHARFVSADGQIAELGLMQVFAFA